MTLASSEALSPVDDARVDTGHVLQLALDLYQAYAPMFLTTAFAVYALVGAAQIALLVLVPTLVPPVVLVGLLAMLGSLLAQGALVVQLVDLLDRRSCRDTASAVDAVCVRLRPLIGVGLAVMAAGALAVAGVLAVAATALGRIDPLGWGALAALGAMPGLYLLARWAVAPVLVLVEGMPAREALAASSQLVGGAIWHVMALTLVVMMVPVGLENAIRTVLAVGFTGLPASVQTYLASVVAISFVAPFAAIVFTLIYYELRFLREGRAALPAMLALR